MTESTMRQLKVVGNSFITGEAATTVRRGFKWAEGKQGEILELWRCAQAHDGRCVEAADGQTGCHMEGLGVVRGKWVGQFKAILARLVDMEHDPESRTYAGLLAAMQRVYQGFADQEYVTVLIYDVGRGK